MKALKRTSSSAQRLAALTGIFILLQATSASAGSVVKGGFLVQRWCSACHAIQAAPTATDAAPSLNALAQTNKANPDWVKSWLTNPHPPMSVLNLSAPEIEDIQAYLRDLAGVPQPKKMEFPEVSSRED